MSSSGSSRCVRLWGSVDAVGVLLALTVAIQVAERLPVGELDLRRVVHGGPHELKHRLLHVCRKKNTSGQFNVNGYILPTSQLYLSILCLNDKIQF